MLRVMGTGPAGGPLAPLGRRTRVITGTNAEAAVVSTPCSSSRSTSVTWVAVGTRKSTASATSMRTWSRSVEETMRFSAV